MKTDRCSQVLRKWLVLVAAIFAMSSVSSAQQSRVVQKKLLEAGWDQLDTARFRQNLEQVEKTPFDGVILNVVGTDDAGKSVSTEPAFSSVPWKLEWFRGSINDLKAIHSKKLTDNFIRIEPNPGNVDWFDDAGWTQIVDHWRIAAEIAREGNLKGILFDPEPYTASYAQLNYAAQPQRMLHSFAQYQLEARLRGREIIAAVASVDPNLVVNTFVMNSVHDDIVDSPDSPSSQQKLQISTYGLYPAFINGWLDAAPPSMIFVDGCEMAYRYNSPLEFLQEANVMRNTTLSLVAPENRAKYLAQVQVGFGFYLDAYVNAPSAGWYIDPKGSTPTQRLQMNVRSALSAANEYVWFDGERHRWWDTPSPGIQTASYWEDVLPGVTDALRTAAHPVEPSDPVLEARQRIAVIDNSGKLGKNLLQNAEFSLDTLNTVADGTRNGWDAIGYPRFWSTWQSNTSHGSFSRDAGVNHSADAGGAARLAGLSNGCFIQSIDIKPGTSFLIRGWLHQVGQGIGSIRIGWQTADSKWINNSLGPVFRNTEAPTQWQEIEGIVTAPEGAGKLVVMPSAEYQPSPQDAIWFDDIQVYAIVP